jgi:hypothetical protein
MSTTESAAVPIPKSGPSHTILSQKWQVFAACLVDWQIIYQWSIREDRSLFGKQILGDIF